MSNIWDEMAKDGVKILAEVGREIEFRGEKILALIDNNPVSEDISHGGFVYSADFKVRLLIVKDNPMINNLPSDGESMIIYGREFTINKITDRRPSPWFDVYVISTDQ